MINSVKKNQTFEQGAILLLVSGLLVKIIGAFFKIPLSSDYCLGDVGFGYFSSVYDVFLPVYTLASSGIPSAVSRIISEYLAEKNYKKADIAFKIFKRIMFWLGIIGTFLLAVFAVPFVGLTDKTGKTLLTFFAMAPAILFCFLSSVYRGYYEGNRNMLPTAFSNVIDALSKLVFGFTTALIVVKLSGNVALGATATMAGITLGTIISYTFLRIYHSRVCAKSHISNEEYFEEDRALFKRLISIALPIVLASLSISLVTFIDSLTVRWSLSSMGENDLNVISQMYSRYNIPFDAVMMPTFLYGIKSKAYTLFNLIPVLTGFIAASALPSIAGSASAALEKLTTTINTALKLTTALSFPMGFGLIFAAKPIMKLLYGDSSYEIGGNILIIYGIAALFAGLLTVLTAILQALNKQNRVLLNFLIGLIIKIISNIILVSIPKLNIYGAAISTVLFFAFVVLAHFLVVVKTLKLRLDYINSIIKTFFSALFCGITAYLIMGLSDSFLITLVGILAAALVYILFLVIFKTFKIEEIKGFIVKKNDF